MGLWVSHLDPTGDPAWMAFGPTGVANAVAVSPDGIVAVGSASTAAAPEALVVGITHDGQLSYWDRYADEDPSTAEEWHGVVVDGVGDVIVAGHQGLSRAGEADIVVRKYRPHPPR